jgi:hypothetical protein
MVRDRGHGHGIAGAFVYSILAEMKQQNVDPKLPKFKTSS